MATPAERVAPPRRRPRQGGLESIADFRPNERLGRAGTLQYDAEVCTAVVGAVQLCFGPDLSLGEDEVQRITITGTPTGGTFRLTFRGEQTGTIAFNATAATVRAALEALPGVGVGDVAVTGGPGPGTPYDVTFTGDLGTSEQPQMTATHAFTGGAAPAIAVTTTTPGAFPKDGSIGFPSGAPILPPFGGYIGVECTMHPDNDFEGRARAALELAQGRYLEEVLWGWLSGGTAITTANTLVKAIAQADNHADANYLGQPIMHLNRGDADEAFAAGALTRQDGKLVTANGTEVVASHEYTAGTVAISGDITVEQSAIVTAPAVDYNHNTEMWIAERVWSVLVDCDYRAEFTVTP